MKEQLNPLFQNYRADSFYLGATIIHNAQNYVKQGQTNWEAADSVYTTYSTDLDKCVSIRKGVIYSIINNLYLYKDDLFKYKPSASYEIVDSNYSIGNNAIKFNTSKENKAHQKKNITSVYLLSISFMLLV